MAKIQNLDDLLADDAEDQEPAPPVVPIFIFGQDFNLNGSVNSFAGMALVSQADADSVYGYFESLVTEEDWPRFRQALGKEKNLTQAKLLKIINAMTEAVAERPTTPPSGSRPGATKKTSSPRSVASTASKRAATSRR